MEDEEDLSKENILDLFDRKYSYKKKGIEIIHSFTGELDYYREGELLYHHILFKEPNIKENLPKKMDSTRYFNDKFINTTRYFNDRFSNTFELDSNVINDTIKYAKIECNYLGCFLDIVHYSNYPKLVKKWDTKDMLQYENYITYFGMDNNPCFTKEEQDDIRMYVQERCDSGYGRTLLYISDEDIMRYDLTYTVDLFLFAEKETKDVEVIELPVDENKKESELNAFFIIHKII